MDVWLPPTWYEYQPPITQPGRQNLNRRKRAKVEYALIQRFWARDRGEAIKGILTSTIGAPRLVPRGTKEFWTQLFDRPSLPEVRNPDPFRGTLPVPYSIKEQELLEALKHMKKGSAPGPDGRKLSDISSLPMDQLLRVLNSIMSLKRVPNTWAMG